MATGTVPKPALKEQPILKEADAARKREIKEEEEQKRDQAETQKLVEEFFYDVTCMNRHFEFVATISERTAVGVIHARLENCCKLRDNIQINLRVLHNRPMTPTIKKKFEEVVNKFESICWDTIGALEDALTERTPLVSSDSTANTSQHYATSSGAPRVKFPVISLPEFSGNLDEWIGFRDRFDSLVNKNEGLSKVDKFNYLLAAVKLPAGQTSVLKNFTLSEANYDSAWTALCERYDDKTKLKAQQFNNMLTMRKMNAESAPELRRIIDDFTSCFATLDLLGATHEDLRVHVVLFRLEDQTRKDWQKFIGDDEATWEKLREFLVKQWRTIVAVSDPNKKPTVRQDSKSSSRTFTSTDVSTCPVCNEHHLLFKCQKFKALSVQERMNAVNHHRLCRNCLSPNHIQRNCSSQNRCKICNQPHHSMLHYERTSNVVQASGASPVANGATLPAVSQRALNATSAPFPQNVSYSSPEKTMNMHSKTSLFKAESPTEAVLSTVSILAMDINGSWHLCRALLDSGSQSNYITTNFARKLGISLVPVNVPVAGINGQTSVVRHATTAIYASRYKDYHGQAYCLVSDDITGFLPHRPISVSEFKIPKDVFLADPKFHVPGKIDMLFGTGIFHKSQLGKTLALQDMLMLVETKFGWTLGGEFRLANTAASFLSCFTQINNSGLDELDEKLDKFMEVENYGLSKKLLTAEEAFCEDLFQKTTRRDETGRIFVQLPFNEMINELGTNWSNSARQFYYQEGNRQKDVIYNKLYCAYIDEMISSGHLSEVSANKTNGHFLPHHGVVRMTSTTTKVRPVCNGASKSETGRSLNDCLHCGPTVQPEIFDILIRFRERPFVLKCDIEKMYRQVFIDPSQRKWQKILWRSSPSEPLKHYELNTVVFGLKPSPFLATRSLNLIADENQNQFPEVSAVIKSSIYVDDLLCSFDSVAQGLVLRDQLRSLLSASHFPTRKWCANDPELLREIPPEDVEKIQDDEKLKTLGLNWKPIRDEVFISTVLSEKVPETKAGILSEIASIYDVLGLFGPVVLRAKLFMKPLRLIKWTEKVPLQELERWTEFRNQLSVLNDVTVQRLTVLSNPVNIQIHGFSDAAEPAYGAAIYIRSCDAIGNVQVSLLCSKSRVSPPKQKSIPRLELCGATLLAKLVTRVIDILTVNIDKVFLWSDSMIVLWWIATVAARLSTFVGNRVSIIQELTSRFTWQHLRGHLNPADDLSRGISPEEIIDRHQWWTGPAFLRLPPSEWPNSLLTIQEDDPDVARELRKTLMESPASSLFNLIESRFSSIKKVTNCIAYIRRLACNDSRKFHGPISIEETELATKNIVRILQTMFFSQELRFFNEKLVNPKENIEFPKNSPLLQLTPFLDDCGILRVGGRIQASPMMTEEQKHPVILPQCKFVKLIIRDFHKKLLHPSQTTMLAHVRQRYWPLKVKTVIRQVQHECLTCFRAKPKTAEQLMGSLPIARVRMSPPFESTAVDYAGYFNLRASLTKKSTIIKAYVAVFKCMSTGAVHFEAVTSLSTPAFIDTFDRFISRRGLSKEIFSDNGTQFVGTDNEFSRIFKDLQLSIGEYLKEKEIKWNFTTPVAPHAGGYYESGVKSMKHHLVRECHGRSFDYEQFSTLLCKIEAVLNSRPLTPMTEDPRDLDVLTPAHFLTGRPLIAKPERNFIPVNTGRLDKYNQLQQLQQKIWDRWYHEYLHTLQTRPLNFRQLKKYHIGDLVIVKDLNLPPLKWLRGRIIELFPDKEGVVRRVLIKTPTGEKVRHVRYLCFLPFERPLE